MNGFRISCDMLQLVVETGKVQASCKRISVHEDENSHS